MARTNATGKLQESPATTIHLVDAEGKSIARADPDAATPEFANAIEVRNYHLTTHSRNKCNGA